MRKNEAEALDVCCGGRMFYTGLCCGTSEESEEPLNGKTNWKKQT